MKETTDQLIDRALGISVQAQPPSGMQQRILSNAENHARNLSRTSVLSLLSRYTSWQLLIASAFTVALLFALVWPHTQRVDQQTASVARLQTDKPANVFAKRDQFNAKPTLRSNQTVESFRNREKGHIQATRVEVSTALDDMHAPSKPAPEMPLTSEEKLLIHAVQSNAPVLLAELEPINRTAHSRRGQANEKAFLENLVAPMTSADLDDRNTAPSPSVSPTIQTLETSKNSTNGEPQ